MARIDQAPGLQEPFISNFPQPVISRRDPTPADKKYPIGMRWVNKATNHCWTLTSITIGLAVWDLNSVDPDSVSIVFSQSPLLTTSEDSAGVATGGNGDINLMTLQQGVIMEQFIIGTQTIIGPRMTTSGLLISLDLEVAHGAEYNFGAPRVNSSPSFIIGTSEPFFFEVGMTIAEMEGADTYVLGFRKSEANDITLINYTDYAAIGMLATLSGTNILTFTALNGSGPTITNTGNAWGGDGANVLLRVSVNASGGATFTINGETPILSGSVKFDTNDVVCPFIHIAHSPTPGEVYITSMKYGLQTQEK